MDSIQTKLTTVKRISSGRLQSLTPGLTLQQLSVLRVLDDFHYAYGSHIQRLLFYDGSMEALTRARNRTLAKLTNNLLVYRYPRRPLPGNKHGSTEHIYALAHAGQRIMNEKRTFERPYRSIERTTAHFNHALMVTEIHVRMVELNRSGHIKLISSQGEPSSHRHYGLHTILKPDGFLAFQVERNGQKYEVHFFIEIELSRQSEPATIAKLNAYREYMRYLNPSKLMPRVLFVTFSMHHRNHLEGILNRNTGTDRDVFATVLFDEAMEYMING